MITDEQRAARTARAVAAAVSAGRDLGITVTEPEVLYDVFSVIVRLAPSPVVVRVPTRGAAHDDTGDAADRSAA
ncbi:hypothetical protein [Amycolatopsis japonica]